MRSDETPDIGTVKLNVPSLGRITGLSFNSSTCQYLGIPYAEIRGRFQRSVPAGPWKNGIWDGTKLGYGPHPHIWRVYNIQTSGRWSKEPPRGKCSFFFYSKLTIDTVPIVRSLPGISTPSRLLLAHGSRRPQLTSSTV